MSELSGRCLCGAVRYTASAPQLTAICHCRNCQLQSGSAFSIVTLVPSDTVSVTGQLATFEDKGESGAIVLRSFCPICGSPILSRSPGGPVTAIKSATLDRGAEEQPTMELFCDRALPWLPPLPTQMKYPRNFEPQG